MKIPKELLQFHFTQSSIHLMGYRGMLSTNSIFLNFSPQNQINKQMISQNEWNPMEIYIIFFVAKYEALSFSSSSSSSSSYSPSYTSHIVAMLVLLLRTWILNPQALRTSFAAKVIGRIARRRSDLDNEAIIVALNLARRGLIWASGPEWNVDPLQMPLPPLVHLQLDV